jgi:hypothetical protein
MRAAAIALIFALGCQSAAAPEFDEIIEGTLEQGDARLPDGAVYDAFELRAKKGQRLTATLDSEDFDPTLHLLDERDQPIAMNDDVRFGVAQAKIEETIPADGQYKLLLMAHEGRGLGAYRLEVRLRTP